MTAPIENISQALNPTPTASTSSSTSGSSSTDSSNTLNQNTFLQLLVAQLQNEDPDNPTDPTQYLSETAQFTQVQSLQSLQTSMSSLISSQQDGSATTMLGKTVTWSDTSGSSPVTMTGVVSGVITTAGNTTGGPELTVTPSGTTQSTTIPLTAVTNVADTASTS